MAKAQPLSSKSINILSERWSQCPIRVRRVRMDERWRARRGWRLGPGARRDARGCLGYFSHRVALVQQPPLAADRTARLLADDGLRHLGNLTLEGGAAAIGEHVDHGEDGLFVLVAVALRVGNAEAASGVENVILDCERRDRPATAMSRSGRIAPWEPCTHLGREMDAHQ